LIVGGGVIQKVKSNGCQKSRSVQMLNNECYIPKGKQKQLNEKSIPETAFKVLI